MFVERRDEFLLDRWVGVRGFCLNVVVGVVWERV